MMHAIYSMSNLSRLIGFVDAEHRDRLPFTDDAGAYASKEPVDDAVRSEALRYMRFMAGAEWQR